MPYPYMPLCFLASAQLVIPAILLLFSRSPHTITSAFHYFVQQLYATLPVGLLHPNHTWGGGVFTTPYQTGRVPLHHWGTQSGERGYAAEPTWPSVGCRVPARNSKPALANPLYFRVLAQRVLPRVTEAGSFYLGTPCPPPPIPTPQHPCPPWAPRDPLPPPLVCCLVASGWPMLRHGPHNTLPGRCPSL
jgi:hypothetical protein